MYDVVIVGGGPAGATLARLIADRNRVLVLDQRDLGNQYRSGYEKCCGGLLAPDAQEMLARFGLGLPQDVLVGPQLFSVRTIDLKAGLERHYPRNYINVDREAFDRWLISLLPDKVDVRWQSLLLGLEKTSQGFQVSFSRHGAIETVQARFVVGADGANSKVRRKLAVNTQALPMYTSIQEWFRVEKAHPYYSAIFDPAVTDFYSWTIPKEDMLLVGTAIPAGADVHQRFDLLKEKLTDWGYDLSYSVKKRGTHLLRPSGIRQICLGKGDAALVGEAAGWISPSSAEGLSYAFRSALALARALESGGDVLRQYSRLCSGLRNNIMVKQLKSPVMYWPLLRRLAMGSGLFSIEIIK